jgi:hypothetical protein
MRQLFADLSLPAGVLLVVLLVGVLLVREAARIRTGRPGTRVHAAAVLGLGSLFVAVVVGRFLVLA